MIRKILLVAVLASFFSIGTMMYRPAVTQAADIYVYTDSLQHTFWLDSNSRSGHGNYLYCIIKKVDQYGKLKSKQNMCFSDKTATIRYTILNSGDNSFRPISENPVAYNAYYAMKNGSR